MHDSDNVIVADTPAFKLYKLNDRGETLAYSNNKTFRFPNQLLYVENALWVADTNHHRLAKISLSSDNFSHIEDTLPTELNMEYRWPNQMAKSSSTWWVNIGDSTMANGRIIQYSNTGDQLAELPTKNAEMRDPLAMTFWQDALWVNNFAKPLIYRFDQNNKSLPEPKSPTLSRLTQTSETQARNGSQIKTFGLASLILVLIGGFYSAWILERKQTLNHFQRLTSGTSTTHTHKPAKPVEEGKIFWLDNTLAKPLRYIKITGVISVTSLLLFSFLTFFGIVPIDTFSVNTLTFLTLMCALTGILLYSLKRHLSQQKIGVIGDSLILHKSDRQKTIARGNNIIFNDRFLMADNVLILIGSPQYRFFDNGDLQDYVFPRLKEARRCGQIEALTISWRASKDQLLIFSVLIAVMILFVVLSPL